MRCGPGWRIAAIAADEALILAFVLIGRASHREADGLGVLTTLWPFTAGLAVGWIVAWRWRTPLRVRWTGITVWLGTLVLGMLLRIASAQGVQVSFVVVAATFLAIFLLGWRGAAQLAIFGRARVRPAGR